LVKTTSSLFYGDRAARAALQVDRRRIPSEWIVGSAGSRGPLWWSRVAGAPALPVLYPVTIAEARPEMSQAVVNPEELRRFAARLKQFNNEMIGQLTTLHGQLAGLSQTWRDREHDKFVEEFEQTLQVVKRFTESTNQHIPFLLRKAERIEEYLQQR
jgi:uncharacterized protein YukE